MKCGDLHHYHQRHPALTSAISCETNDYMKLHCSLSNLYYLKIEPESTLIIVSVVNAQAMQKLIYIITPTQIGWTWSHYLDIFDA